MTEQLLTFNDFLLLLIWIFSISFAAYVISHIASFFPRFMASVTKSFKATDKYNRDYNLRFLRFKSSPVPKDVKKNHGRNIFNSRKR